MHEHNKKEVPLREMKAGATLAMAPDDVDEWRMVQIRSRSKKTTTIKRISPTLLG
jgi:hypothetical protein